MTNRIIEYFDLASVQRNSAAAINAKGGNGQSIHWIPQYVFFCAGIFIEPYIQVIASGDLPVIINSPLRIISALIIGLLLFPTVYKKVFDLTTPIMVQLMAIIPIGIGWRDLWNVVPLN